jgi:hypothetical protein
MLYLAAKVKGVEVVFVALAAGMPRVDSQNLRAAIATECVIVGI